MAPDHSPATDQQQGVLCMLSYHSMRLHKAHALREREPLRFSQPTHVQTPISLGLIPDTPLMRTASSKGASNARGSNWMAAAVAADSRGPAAALAADRLRRGVALDITALPGTHLLSLKVCGTLLVKCGRLGQHESLLCECMYFIHPPAVLQGRNVISPTYLLQCFIASRHATAGQ